jgi:hypothetical protein
VNDFYGRFIRPEASQKELVLVGRISTAILMVLAGALALVMESALDNFQIILQIGAGTGLIFIMRWFWWRVNAAAEVAAMVVSFLIAIYFQFLHGATGLPELNVWQELITGVIITTIAWFGVMKMTRPTSFETLVNFINLVRPGGPGWEKVRQEAKQRGYDLERSDDDAWMVPQGILCMILGTVAIYGALLATGFWIYKEFLPAIILTVVTVVASGLLIKSWKKLLKIR